MGITKRNKVSAQFSMSSLTDIIFLLLIFFMLTFSLVAPNALNLKLPSSSSQRVVSTDRLDRISISASGEYFLNGRQFSLRNLERELARRARSSSARLNLTIEPAPGTPTEYVVSVMELAMRYDINGILATGEGR
jgi:biopolymer transport protein ExbD